ncbi:nitroreductase family deazaflavin-dependent oxidoreductase [Streptomyces sp. NPDC000931]|uniref:nitroreductase family deazaflavin-dependent oxidoreductase n=1 Tax=Streptomyces sp. NPDC000931 TaxID=3154372 RepID=UPI00332262CA
MINKNAPIGRPRRPTGWRRRALRLPILAYRVGLGSLFGKRLLLLHHTGRVSGRDRTTVLEVVSFDAVEASWTVASGFGSKADWYQNLRARPQSLIRFGNRPHPVTAHFLSSDDGAGIMDDYARRHPRTARRLCAYMGLPVDGSKESFRTAGRAIPFVRLEAGAGHRPAGRRHQ